MLNDREDKYEDHEESEYHFSDDEVSYEVEPESPKAAAASVETKENLLNRLSGSKRMIISLVVFLVLVFIVYKMVAPSSTAPLSTEITSPVTAQQSTITMSQQGINPSLQAQVPPPATATTNTTNTNMSAALQSMQGVVPAQTTTTTVSTAPSLQSQVPPPAAVNVAPGAQTLPGTNPQVAPTGMQPPPPEQAMTPSGMTPPAAIAVQGTQAPVVTTTGMPAVMPVQTPEITTTQSPPIVTTGPATVESKLVTVANTSDKLVTQLQAEYTQRINEYSSQNKALQDQVQTLNARMASMETQMGQLIQALTRQNQAAPPAPPPVQREAADSKVGYNVQAIIPGRAWLRSDSGETVTVAEGDLVRDLGRISKIDPYDGVVEINTGTKVISLTYGNGES